MDSLYDKNSHDFCFEFKKIEKAIEVAVTMNGEETGVKFEALRDEKNGRYSVATYIQKSVTLQPTYPQKNGRFEKSPEDFILWVSWIGFPWVAGDSADAVLMQALGFLRERCDSN